MQYQEAVAEARRLVKRSEDDQWRLAQLTAEVAEQGTVLKRWAEDTSMSYGHVKKLRQVWLRFGAGVPGTPRRSFTEAYALVKDPTLADEPDIGAAANREEAKSAVRNMPPEQKAEVVREALDDQDVAVRVLRDPHTRRNVTDARQRVVEEIESTNRDHEQASPIGRAVREATLELEIENGIYAARFKLAEVARKLMDLPARDPAVTDRMERALGEVDTALGWARTVLAGGQVDDDELIRLLEGGA